MEESTEKPLPTEESLTFTPVPPSLADDSTATSAPTPTATAFPTSTPLPTTLTAQETPATEATSPPARTEAQVVEVVDGDTIKVNIGGGIHTVRYIGIDTPETKHPDEPIEWMGPEASAANRELVGGQTVYLEKDVSETDQYGRLLRYVFLANGTFVNAKLVEQGYAQAVSYPPDVKYQDLLASMQQKARETARGLWGPTPTYVPPTATLIPPTAVPLSPSPVPPTETPIIPTATPLLPTSVPATATSVPPTPIPPTATPVSQPTQPSATCDCSGNVYNCKNFSTHAQAQACYEYCISVGAGDIHRLDRDNDGIACESLP